MRPQPTVVNVGGPAPRQITTIVSQDIINKVSLETDAQLVKGYDEAVLVTAKYLIEVAWRYEEMRARSMDMSKYQSTLAHNYAAVVSGRLDPAVLIGYSTNDLAIQLLSVLPRDEQVALVRKGTIAVSTNRGVRNIKIAEIQKEHSKAFDLKNGCLIPPKDQTPEVLRSKVCTGAKTVTITISSHEFEVLVKKAIAQKVTKERLITDLIRKHGLV
jgi:hypothetical protein